MQTKHKMWIALTLAVLFGFSGFNAALGGIIAGYGVIYALGALIPFMLCTVAFFDQWSKLRNEKVL